MESVGFKEWANVCEALGRGEQTVLLRKGGIAEGRDGFGFRHSGFFLFPTFFHEQIDKVRISGAEIPKAREGEIEIRYFAKLVQQEELLPGPPPRRSSHFIFCRDRSCASDSTTSRLACTSRWCVCSASFRTGFFQMRGRMAAAGLG
jgi:hypothetical protein